MAEIEKVVRGLECCCEQHGGPELCEQCPYTNEPFPCGNAIMRDALALLRARMPRVLTVDRVCGGDECWIEYKYGGHGYADVYLEEPDGTALVYRCKPVGDRKPETVWLHDYGKLWRGWNYRPSPEQMRETPWEGDAE